MFPLSDDNPTELTPYVTYALILACVAVWILLQGAGMSEAALVSSVCGLGAIPGEITGGLVDGVVPLGQGNSCTIGGATWSTLITSIFLHGSWMHLIGNMWFLWIFGNNVEDSMGHGRFILFYLICGLVADFAHIASDPTSAIPTVGASGAISGVLGAYFLLYPKAKVKTLIFLLFFVTIQRVPAALFLGLWFLLQLASSFADGGGAGGVAFWAHIGGFVAGLALIRFFRNPDLVAAKQRGVVLDRSQIPHGGWW